MNTRQKLNQKLANSNHHFPENNQNAEENFSPSGGSHKKSPENRFVNSSSENSGRKLPIIFSSAEKNDIKRESGFAKENSSK